MCVRFNSSFTLSTSSIYRPIKLSKRLIHLCDINKTLDYDIYFINYFGEFIA